MDEYQFKNYIEYTDEYERALSALLQPNGRRLSEIANNKHTQVSKNVIQKTARYLVEDNILLIESDGKKSDPRIYRNNVLSMFQIVWRIYATYGPNSIQERLDELEEEIDMYRDKSGYDSPQELLEAIKDKQEDISHIETDGTGEVFWDVYSPWSNTQNQIYFTKLTMKISDEIEENMEHIDFDVSGPYGDFSNINAIRAKLGIDEQPSDNATLNEDGTLSKD